MTHYNEQSGQTEQTREEFITEINALIEKYPVTMHNLMAVNQDPDHRFYPFRVVFDGDVIASVE